MIAFLGLSPAFYSRENSCSSLCSGPGLFGQQFTSPRFTDDNLRVLTRPATVLAYQKPISPPLLGMRALRPLTAPQYRAANVVKSNVVSLNGHKVQLSGSARGLQSRSNGILYPNSSAPPSISPAGFGSVNKVWRVIKSFRINISFRTG